MYNIGHILTLLLANHTRNIFFFPLQIELSKTFGLTRIVFFIIIFSSGRARQWDWFSWGETIHNSGYQSRLGFVMEKSYFFSRGLLLFWPTTPVWTVMRLLRWQRRAIPRCDREVNQKYSRWIIQVMRRRPSAHGPDRVWLSFRRVRFYSAVHRPRRQLPSSYFSLTRGRSLLNCYFSLCHLSLPPARFSRSSFQKVPIFPRCFFHLNLCCERRRDGGSPCRDRKWAPRGAQTRLYPPRVQLYLLSHLILGAKNHGRQLGWQSKASVQVQKSWDIKDVLIQYSVTSSINSR